MLLCLMGADALLELGQQLVPFCEASSTSGAQLTGSQREKALCA